METEDGEEEPIVFFDDLVFEVGRPPGLKPGTPLDFPVAVNSGPLPLGPGGALRVATLDRRPVGRGLAAALHDAGRRRRRVSGRRAAGGRKDCGERKRDRQRARAAAPCPAAWRAGSRGRAGGSRRLRAPARSRPARPSSRACPTGGGRAPPVARKRVRAVDASVAATSPHHSVLADAPAARALAGARPCRARSASRGSLRAAQTAPRRCPPRRRHEVLPLRARYVAASPVAPL